jgi:glycosyltransferase involved in cell wall biosynthesis
MITHLSNGWLAKPFDPASLAEGINFLANHPEKSAFAIRAREKAVADYSIEVVAAQYMSLYRELMHQKQ